MKPKLIASILVLTLTALACGVSAESEPTGELTADNLQGTQVALESTAQAINAAQTEQAAPTATPIPTKYPTKVPTATPTPGPLVINDEFNEDVGRWGECTRCAIADGVFYLGPYEKVDSYEGYLAICKECGYVEYYKMGVDVTYMTGASDRGFGLVLWERDGYYVDVELTTWQVYGAWYYDKDEGISGRAWKTVTGKGFVLSGLLRPGRQTNRVEVVVEQQDGKRMATVYINGKKAESFEMYGGPGRVGLVVGLHSLGVAFDNFTFEGMPVSLPGSPENNG